MSNFSNKQQQFVPLAIDMGTSGWKIIFKKHELYIPSLVASGELRERMNGVFDDTSSQATVDNITVDTDFGLRHVGNLAKRAETSWSGFDRMRYNEPDFMNPMTLAAMSEANVVSDTVIVITAVPAEWINQEMICKDYDQPVPITKVISDHFMKDTHVVIRKGKRGQKVVNVTDVHVLTETKGLLYSHILNKSGQPAIDNYDGLTTVTIDIGKYTTCFDVFEGLNRVIGSQHTYTDISTGKIHDAVSRKIKEETGRDITPWQVEDLVLGDGIIYVNRGKENSKFDIMPLYEEACHTFKNILVAHAANVIQSPADVHYVLVGGGGGLAIGDAIKKRYPGKAKICGQHATAQGLANYGRIICDLNNG